MVLSTTIGAVLAEKNNTPVLTQGTQMLAKAFKFVEPMKSPLEKTKVPLLQILEDSEPEEITMQTFKGSSSMEYNPSAEESQHHQVEIIQLEEEVELAVKTEVSNDFSQTKSFELRKSLDGNRSGGKFRRSLDMKRSKRATLKRFLKSMDPRKLTWKGILRLSLLVVLLAGIFTFLGFLIGSNNVQIVMLSALEWLGKLPMWASSLLMSFMYCGALLLFCPGTPFNLAAGFLFGMYLGTGVAVGGCMMGALLAFFLGRTIARDWVKSKMEQKPKFKAVDWAIQKNGIYIIFLTRLSPLFPFPLLNYAFGITKVSLLQYFVGTLAGVLPATVGYTYLGTLMRNLTDVFTTSDKPKEKDPNFILLVVGSVLTLLSIIVISLITKRAISKATAEYAKQEELEKQNKIASEVSSAIRTEEMQAVHPQVKLDEISP